jgi:hypothetical protein
LAGSGCNLILSENTLQGLKEPGSLQGGVIDPPVRKNCYIIPPGRRSRSPLPASRQFLNSVVAVPVKTFDARRDFGAAGNNKTDDTAAIQRTIDAASQHGRGAIAYLPAGRYLVTRTLHVAGKDCHFGGAGIYATRLEWRGPGSEPTLRVTVTGRLTIENLGMSRASRISLAPATETGPDILQEETADRSLVIYDGVRVSEKDQRHGNPPFAGGLVCRNLGPRETVLAPFVKGNLHFVDCGRATILIPISYYGSVTVEGKSAQRGGVLGMMSRFNGGKWDIIVKDNHNLVLSDYYNETSNNILWLEGGPDDPPGRVTMQGAKLNFSEVAGIELRNYAGQVFVGPDQFNGTEARKIAIAGSRPAELFLIGNTFYHALPEVSRSGGGQLYQMGSWPVGVKLDPRAFADSLPKEKAVEIAKALDDLRRLEELDLRWNHPSAAGDGER